MRPFVRELGSVQAVIGRLFYAMTVPSGRPIARLSGRICTILFRVDLPEHTMCKPGVQSSGGDHETGTGFASSTLTLGTWAPDIVGISTAHQVGAGENPEYDFLLRTRTCGRTDPNLNPSQLCLQPGLGNVGCKGKIVLVVAEWAIFIDVTLDSSRQLMLITTSK